MKKKYFWEQYDLKTQRSLLEDIARQYWDYYKELTQKADEDWLTDTKKITPLVRGKKRTEKYSAAFLKIMEGNRLAQPVLEGWIDICQHLQKVIR